MRTECFENADMMRILDFFFFFFFFLFFFFLKFVY